MRRGPPLVALTLLSLSLVVALWNQTRPGVEHIDKSATVRWQRSFVHKRPRFASRLGGPDLALTATGVTTLRDMIGDATPVHNPLRILWEHVRYWANSRSYPVQIRITNETGESWVAFYQHGNQVFVRHANPLHNVVLHNALVPDELERALEPHVINIVPTDSELPAELEPAKAIPNRTNE